MSTSTAETTSPTVKVGDFFVSSWGYDQTNVDFYKVVGMTPSGKSVKVQQWTSKVVGAEGGPQESVVPGDEPRTYVDWSGVTEGMNYWEKEAAKVVRPCKVETKRLSTYGDTAYFSVNSYSSARLWDGKPKYQTGFGWGH